MATAFLFVLLMLLIAVGGAVLLGTNPPVGSSTPSPAPGVGSPSPVLSIPPSPSTSPSTAPAPPRTAEIVMSGDLLWHNTVWISAAEDHRRTGAGTGYDFDPMMAALKPVVESADVAVCHEEVPFAAVGQQPASYPVFAAPREVAPWIAGMGWDACTTASNHSWDQGLTGVVGTADLLARYGVAHVGTFRSLRERREDPVVLTTDQGVRVGIVAATYGLNGFVLPDDQWWAVSTLDETRDDLLTQAHRAREAGADIVVAHLHWGTEYDPLPDQQQLDLAERLTASPDVDLVLGEHAHVVQPITKVNDKWVVYGMGNMVAQNEVARPATYEGITVSFEFTERADGGWEVSRAGYYPTQWNHYSGGDPIRVRQAAGDHLASIRSAVNAVGRNKGLQELSLPR